MSSTDDYYATLPKEDPELCEEEPGPDYGAPVASLARALRAAIAQWAESSAKEEEWISDEALSAVNEFERHGILAAYEGAGEWEARGD